MDIFMEYLVKHKKSGADYAKIVGIVLLSIILILASLVFLLGTPFSTLLALLICGIIFGAYKLIKRLDVEYEYILTNNFLDIDRIMGKSTRKRMISIDIKEIDILASVDDINHKHEFENTAIITKTQSFIGSGLSDYYFIDFKGENGKERVVFEPPLKLLEAARKHKPSCVFIK